MRKSKVKTEEKRVKRARGREKEALNSSETIYCEFLQKKATDNERRKSD